jgi:hypothetical protein
MKMIKHIQGKKKKIFLFNIKTQNCSLLLVTSTHLYILRKLPEYKTMANVVSSRWLKTISKITSKKHIPEIITFRYAISEEQDEEQEKARRANMKNTKKKIPIDCDKVYLVDAGDATKNIKVLIMKALDMFDNLNEPVST